MGNGYVGGLVGGNDGTVTGSYWNTDATATGIGGGTVTGATGANDVQMRQQVTFSGWDFDNIWRIDEGHSYPLLRSDAGKPHDGLGSSYTPPPLTAVNTPVTITAVTTTGSEMIQRLQEEQLSERVAGGYLTVLPAFIRLEEEYVR